MSIIPIPRRVALGLAAGAVAALAASPASAFPAGPLDEHWLGRGEGPEPDHDPWAQFLAAWRVVGPDGIARLRYGAVPEADRDALRRYVDGLAATPVTTLPRAAQFALWANLYNALTVDLVLARYPVGSIREIGGGLFTRGPWSEELVRVEGRDLSLDDIEHGILRPVWRDPRIHYAVNCASLGCPDIGAGPFRAAGLSGSLDAAARAYVNHPRGAAPGSGGGLVLSGLYDWYEDDFGGGEPGVLAHLEAHAGAGLRALLGRTQSIESYRYDWSLNDGTALP